MGGCRHRMDGLASGFDTCGGQFTRMAVLFGAVRCSAAINNFAVSRTAGQAHLHQRLSSLRQIYNRRFAKKVRKDLSNPPGVDWLKMHAYVLPSKGPVFAAAGGVSRP